LCPSTLSRPPPPPPFPYTTLFRSLEAALGGEQIAHGLALIDDVGDRGRDLVVEPAGVVEPDALGPHRDGHRRAGRGRARGGGDRSEEHTSELQSRFDLVCRLLLEK